MPATRTRFANLGSLALITLGLGGVDLLISPAAALPPQAQAAIGVAAPALAVAGQGQPAVTGTALAEVILARPVGVAVEAGIGAVVAPPMGQPAETGTNLAVTITTMAVGAQPQQGTAAGLSVFAAPGE